MLPCAGNVSSAKGVWHIFEMCLGERQRFAHDVVNIALYISERCFKWRGC